MTQDPERPTECWACVDRATRVVVSVCRLPLGVVPADDDAVVHAIAGEDCLGRRLMEDGSIDDSVSVPRRLDVPARSAVALQRRDGELAGSDWTGLMDAPLTRSQRAAWAVYRRALRDLPAHPDWPDMPWPVRPA